MCARAVRLATTHLGERHRSFRTAANGKHQVERSHAEVVLGSSLDCYFLQRRDALVARRTQDPNVRWPVVHEADEIFAVTIGNQTIGIGQADAVGIIPGEQHVGMHYPAAALCYR